MFIVDRDENIGSILDQLAAELIDVAAIFYGTLCEPIIELIVKMHPVLQVAIKPKLKGL